MKFDIPLLDSVEALKGWDGDKDDNCLLAVADFNLDSRSKSQHASSIYLKNFCNEEKSSNGPQPVRKSTIICIFLQTQDAQGVDFDFDIGMVGSFSVHVIYYRFPSSIDLI